MDKEAFRSLLPENSTPLEKALECAVFTDELHGVLPRLSAFWNPRTCPVQFLPYLAWAVAVDIWDSEWTEATKRRVIETWIALRRIRGTVGAVKGALAVLDLRSRVEEWWETSPPGKPGTMTVYASAAENLPDGRDSELTLKNYALVARVVESMKRASCHYVFHPTVSYSGRVGFAARARLTPIVRVGARLEGGRDD